MYVSNINRISPLALGPSVMQRTQASASFRAQRDNLGLKGETRVFNEIQSIKMRLNDLAEDIKKSSRKGDKILEEIKARLNEINKFFPPYPPGSEDRVRLIKGYVAFRLLIEKLTIPPETDVIGMTDKKALERSISLMEDIVAEDKGITINSEGLQNLSS